MRAPATLAAVLLLLPLAGLLGHALPDPGPLPGPGNLPVRLPRGPILIEGDEAFTLLNGVVAGQGTAQDPYLIAGWDVLAIPGVQDGITLRGTRAHVVLRHNYVHEGDPGYPVSYCRYQLAIQCNPLPVPPPTRGIVLEDAQNVVAEENFVRRTAIGVHLQASAAVLRGNQVMGYAAFAEGQGCSDPLEGQPVPPPPLPRQFTLHTLPKAGVVAVGSTLAVEGGSFRCAAAGIWGAGSSARVREVAMRDVRDGIAFWGGSALDVENATVEATGFSYTFADGTTGQLRGSNSHGAQRAVWVCGGGTRALVQGNDLGSGPGEANDAVAVMVGPTPGCPGNPHAELVANVVGNHYAGVHWADATGRIEDNVVAPGHWYGIYTQFASPAIRGNLVRGHEQGIIARCHAGTIEGNTLVSNARGLVVYHAGGLGCGASVKPMAAGNRFLGNTAYDVVNTEDMLYTPEPTPGQVALDVRDSWWGSPAGPDPARVRGAVLAAPWAEAEP